ncbi:MAG: SDR family NAD(P)-dependent oxidoreductase [bacterium]|nr:SDR family NAD(P)-dependent oxidoreductase [bacterium]
MFDLNGKTAMVTGAGQNVGAGVAHTLASQGAHVLVNDIVADRATEVADAIAAAGHSADALPFDVTDGDAVREAIAGRPIDILVNNAGNGGAEDMAVKAFADTEPADWIGPLAVNLDGVMNCTHAVLSGMIERGWGRIIGVVSGAGTVGVNIGVAAYSAGKGGAAGLLRSVALEVAKTGVTVNSIALGLMSNTAGGDITEQLARAIPTRRLGTPEDVAALCAYLASEEASWMTAQTIPLAGGSITS